MPPSAVSEMHNAGLFPGGREPPALTQSGKTGHFAGGLDRRHRLLRIKQGSRPKTNKIIETTGPTSFDLGKSIPRFDLFPQSRTSVDHIKRRLVIDVLIKRLLKLEAIRIEPSNGADQGDSGHKRLERMSISHVNLNASASLAGEFVKGGLEVSWTENNPGKAVLLQFIYQLVWLDVGRADELKRPRGSAPFRQVCTFDHNGAGINDCRVDGRYVWRRHHPG